MKKKKLVLALTSAVLALTTVIGAETITANAATAEKKTMSVKSISSKNWMKYLRDDIKLNEITIPGAHDAAIVHSSAVYPVSVFVLTQKYHIGTQTWTDKGFFRKDRTVSEEGLLERGVRYLDIRYGFIKGDRKHSDIKYASNKLRSLQALK